MMLSCPRRLGWLVAPAMTALLASVLVVATNSVPAQAARPSLGIPKSTDGHRTNVGLLFLGHSTSQQGDYPGKLAQALNARPATDDGRNYVRFPVIVGGDGGFLWSQAKFTPADPQFHRAAASMQTSQWCADGSGNRWSVRRVALDKSLTGVTPTGTCVTYNPPAIMCTWYDAAGAHTQSLAFLDCWRRMDVKLAFIQDTANRSWPIDDFTGDGQVTGGDFWPASQIPVAAQACTNGRSGVVNASIDWNCDGQLSQPADSALLTYASWLESLSLALVNNYGGDSVDHVFLSPKPLEFGASCAKGFPGVPGCGVHALRSPTASRPYDHFYHPWVYWEHRVVQQVVNKAGLDPRIHLGPTGALSMHYRSAVCYASGLTTWVIPAVAGRPATVAADDSEWQGGAEVNPDTTGCVKGDHIHHTEAGGWMMADVWYAGMLDYLA